MGSYYLQRKLRVLLFKSALRFPPTPFSFALYLDGKHFGELFFDTVVFIFSGISVCPATTAMRL